MRSVVLFAVLVGLASVALAPARASAQETSQAESDEQAHLHFQVAAQYYQEADYESALREFESAYRLSQRPQLLYNIALCQQQLGNLDEAVSTLERYLAEVPDVENRPLLEQRLANLRARRDRQQQTGTDPGEESTEEAPQTPPPPPPSDSTNIPSIVGFGVAGVGLVSAVIFSVLALTENDRIGALDCGATLTCPSSETSALGTYALVADISWGLSLAGAIVGTVFLFVPTGGESASSQAALRVTPVAGTVNGLSLSGSF